MYQLIAHCFDFNESQRIYEAPTRKELMSKCNLRLADTYDSKLSLRHYKYKVIYDDVLKTLMQSKHLPHYTISEKPLPKKRRRKVKDYNSYSSNNIIQGYI